MFYIYFIFSKDSKSTFDNSVRYKTEDEVENWKKWIKDSKSKFDNSVRYKTEDEPENGKKLNKVENFFQENRISSGKRRHFN